jgi:hypothetical protein
MTKKFELSAYGVEEMNQKELIDVEGGSLVEFINAVWEWLVNLYEFANSPEGQAIMNAYNQGFRDGYKSGVSVGELIGTLESHM